MFPLLVRCCQTGFGFCIKAFSSRSYTNLINDSTRYIYRFSLIRLQLYVVSLSLLSVLLIQYLPNGEYSIQDYQYVLPEFVELLLQPLEGGIFSSK